MTGRITRIAALGAGAVLALGFFTAAPAGASDGAQTDTNVQVGTADVVSQTLGLVNQACADAGRLGGAATSALASADGISVASNQAGTGLNLAVSLPALSGALPGLGPRTLAKHGEALLRLIAAYPADRYLLPKDQGNAEILERVERRRGDRRS